MNTQTVSRGNQGITLDLFDVERAEFALETVNTREAVEKLIGSQVEACSGLSLQCCAEVSTHPLLTAAALAHAQHRPLVLSPDMIWIAILQGLSIHLEENWTELRSQVVSSRLDQRVVEVTTEEFPIGSPETPWGDLITEAASTAYAAVDESLADLFGTSFSTTSPHDRAAMDLAFLASVNSYITLYDISSICGIPSVTIEGTADDWRQMRRLVDGLDRYGLSWWTEFLRPICDNIVGAFESAADLDFWRRIYSISDPICGDLDRVTGWIGHLFPYISSIAFGMKQNPQFLNGEPPSLECFPIGLREISMQSRGGTTVVLMGGFLGIAQVGPHFSLRPKTGWAVRRQNSFESLLDRCGNADYVTAVSQDINQRVTLGLYCKRLKEFYGRFQSMQIRSGEETVCEFLSPEEVHNVRENPPVRMIARLADDGWIGAMDVLTSKSMLAFLKQKKIPRTAYFVGDSATKSAGGVADFITTDFASLLTDILDGAQQRAIPAFDVVASIDPQDRDAIEEVFPNI